VFHVSQVPACELVIVGHQCRSRDRVHLIRRALSVGFSLPELTTILKMRDGGVVPCRRVQAMAESKLEQVKQQIKNLVEMRNQLEEMLKHWNIKLARTRPGQPARLLEEKKTGKEGRP
jgi:hypothetical protein